MEFVVASTREALAHALQLPVGSLDRPAEQDLPPVQPQQPQAQQSPSFKSFKEDALSLSRELDVVRILEREAILGLVVLVVTLVDQGRGVDGRLHAVHVLGVVPMVGERDEPLYLTRRKARANGAGIEAAAPSSRSRPRRPTQP